MKENTVKKLKLLAKILYWVFIGLGLITLALNVYNAVKYMVAENDVVALAGTILGQLTAAVTGLSLKYSYLIAAIISFGMFFLSANVIEALVNGFAIIVEEAAQNTKDNEKLVASNEKIFTALECLNNNVCNLNVKEVKEEKVKEEKVKVEKQETPEVKKEIKLPGNKKLEPVKKDLSELKKPALKPREGLSKLEEVQSTKKNTGDNIKAKLEKVRADVQKIMAVKSQIEANSVDGTMLDDVKDKASIVNFETPEKYNQIENGLFKGCKNLETIVITDNIKLIGNKAFGGCKALTTVEIGKGVEVIEDSAFDECTGLKNVIYKGSKTQWDEMVIQSGNELLKGANIEFKE